MGYRITYTDDDAHTDVQGFPQVEDSLRATLGYAPYIVRGGDAEWDVWQSRAAYKASPDGRPLATVRAAPVATPPQPPATASADAREAPALPRHHSRR